MESLLPDYSTVHIFSNSTNQDKRLIIKPRKNYFQLAYPSASRRSLWRCDLRRRLLFLLVFLFQLLETRGFIEELFEGVLFEERGGEIAALDRHVGQQLLLMSFLQNVLFDRLLGYQPVNVDVAGLTCGGQSIYTINS